MQSPLEVFGVRRQGNGTDCGSLYMEEVALEVVAARFGTPTFVYSRAALVDAYRRLDNALDAARQGRSHLVCYAVKANSNLTVLNLFARLGAGFDIVSGGELRRVIAAGGDPAKVVFSGLGKSAEEIRFALEKGIKCFNVESAPELERINDIAATLGKRAPVSLRVNPDVDAQTHPYISTGLKNNKFGIAFDHALDLYRRAAQLSHLDVAGIDCHIGSQLTTMAPLLDAMGRIVSLTDRLADEGIQLRHICPGGGIGITYSNESTIDFSAYAQALQHCLGARDIELLLEPGRALTGNAGLLLAKVEYVKLGEARNFLVIDAAMNDLIRPSLYQAHHEIVMVKAGQNIDERRYDVVGPVCESADVLGHDRALVACEGDLVAILSAGAYGFAMSSNYNSRPRAAEVMVDGATMHLVRIRESFDDLIVHEQIPPA